MFFSHTSLNYAVVTLGAGTYTNRRPLAYITYSGGQYNASFKVT